MAAARRYACSSFHWTNALCFSFSIFTSSEIFLNVVWFWYFSNRLNIPLFITLKLMLLLERYFRREVIDETIWYCCRLCDKKYKWLSSVYKHFRFECNKTPQFICTLCNKGYTQKVNLKKHLNNIHQMTESIWEL